jgi:hypothetical protein
MENTESMWNPPQGRWPSWMLDWAQDSHQERRSECRWEDDQTRHYRVGLYERSMRWSGSSNPVAESFDSSFPDG